MTDEKKPLHPDYSVNYLEFHAPSVANSKKFYNDAFGWTFEDWGPEYTSFSRDDSPGASSTEKPSASGEPLVILHARELEEAQAAGEKADGEIVKPIFSFP